MLSTTRLEQAGASVQGGLLVQAEHHPDLKAEDLLAVQRKGQIPLAQEQ